MTLRTFQRIAAAALATAFATGALVSSPADATSASCKSNIYKKNLDYRTDEYRAGAYCSYVASDTKVRAKLVRNGGPDYTGVWFTGEYIWRYTPWKTCYAGCWDKYEVGDR